MGETVSLTAPNIQSLEVIIFISFLLIFYNVPSCLLCFSVFTSCILSGILHTLCVVKPVSGT